MVAKAQTGWCADEELLADKDTAPAGEAARLSVRVAALLGEFKPVGMALLVTVVSVVLHIATGWLMQSDGRLQGLTWLNEASRVAEFITVPFMGWSLALSMVQRSRAREVRRAHASCVRSALVAASRRTPERTDPSAFPAPRLFNMASYVGRGVYALVGLVYVLAFLAETASGSGTLAGAVAAQVACDVVATFPLFVVPIVAAVLTVRGWARLKASADRAASGTAELCRLLRAGDIEGALSGGWADPEGDGDVENVVNAAAPRRRPSGVLTRLGSFKALACALVAELVSALAYMECRIVAQQFAGQGDLVFLAPLTTLFAVLMVVFQLAIAVCLVCAIARAVRALGFGPLSGCHLL